MNDEVSGESSGQRHAALVAGLLEAFITADPDLRSVLDALVNRVVFGPLLGASGPDEGGQPAGTTQAGRGDRSDASAPARGLADACLVLLLSEDGQQLRPAAVRHRDSTLEGALWQALETQALPAHEKAVTRALAARAPLVLERVSASALHAEVAPAYWPVVDRFAERSVLIMPLFTAGKALGAITLSRQLPGQPYTPEEVSAIQQVADQAALAIERGQLFDALTAELARREQAEAALRASRDQLEAILQGVADGVLVQDQQGHFIYGNDVAARLAGFGSVKEFLSATAFEVSKRLAVLDAEGRPFPYEQLPARRALRGEPEPEMLVQFRRRNTGEVRWSLTRSRAVLSASGEPLAISIFHDVTDSRITERRLRYLSEASALLPASLNAAEVLDAISQVAVRTLADWAVVYLADEKGDLRQVASARRDAQHSEVVTQLQTQYPQEVAPQSVVWQVLQDKRPRLIPQIGPELLERVARDPQHLQLLQRLQLSSVIYAPLVARQRTLGVVGWFTVGAERHFTEHDLTIAQEIAQRAALALDNARLYGQARQAVGMRDEFLSIASHELRTPVTAIKGLAQLLRRAYLRGVLGEDRLDRSLAQIVQQSTRLATLTDDLLDVSRLQTGRFQMHREPLDLARFAETVVETFGAQVDEQRHTLTFQATGECQVEGDATRLAQVLDNLLSNAVKYSPEGGEVAVRVYREGDQVVMSVRDQGIGLPPQAERYIFEPFGRASNASERQIRGMGLGLYLCRQLVERHGGTISAESAGEGRGTTMRVRLPHLTAPATPETPPAGE